uniref:very-long-chain (3R)-3-hydroxyacyl-CoA dehydratase n=1 Tax=Sexangularia sp. CB-2014 TaxID=1486929 RepID=A0A7S1YKN3_9EUKA|mmetsp:Transcript_737/g.2269  ORF Transcript_737/g.2269 Transcript_737/m.2269 type:complete len:223 (+) Transcript_737:86-754(+)
MVYLIVYNLVQVVLWLAVATKWVETMQEGGTGDGYPAWLAPLVLSQVLSLAEIAHVKLQLVRGGVATTSLQCLARLIIVAAWCSPTLLHRPDMTSLSQRLAATIVVAAWTVTELVRYPYYLSLALPTPPLLAQYLRYLRFTLFIIAYPTGLVGELIILTATLYHTQASLPPVLRAVPLPPPLAHFSFSVLHAIFYLLYLYGFPTLYRHMWRQRAKNLRPKKE